VGADGARYLARWELSGVTGVVVAVDVIRAFTTAAYAFGAGAKEIWLVGGVQEALDLGAAMPGSLVMGEEHGRRPAGFHLSNSPVEVATADVDGRSIVQRTSAGTRGVVAAVDADRLFAASLVCASATAAAVNRTGLGAPTYVVTGRFEDALENGSDDLETAQFIERVRTGQIADVDLVVKAVRGSGEAARTLALGEGDVHPLDVDYATDVDRFGFAMEVERVDGRLRLHTVG
jgi:2-phosphosulfolactate phosphatase